ncbi:MAG: hypothetical protein DRP60_14975 [Spirochaetes bacterium]|nr:MAG: hypothetical protein DRP60_14975 [Spirochaetota bacterium]
MNEALTNPLALLAVTVSLGLAVGRIRIGQFSLGSSGTLFVGLAIGWLVIRTSGDAQKTVLLSKGVIPSEIFYLALALFIAAVALASAQNLGKVVKVYGFRLLAMGALLPAVGASASWGFPVLFPVLFRDQFPVCLPELLPALRDWPQHWSRWLTMGLRLKRL